MPNKILILTSITNDKDQLLDPPQKFDNCDYIAFVDKEYDTKIWEQRPIINFSFVDRFKDRRNAKPYKSESPQFTRSRKILTLEPWPLNPKP
jgi:hypothetical protein